MNGEPKFEHPTRARTLLAMIVAPIIGGIVYMVLVLASSPEVGGLANPRTWELILPATLVGTLFEVFVVLPLWLLVRPIRWRAHLLFVTLATATWLFCTALLLVRTKLSGNEILVEATQVFVPGLVLVLVFDLLARWGVKPPGATTDD
jgi:hypothetical protein